MIQRAKRQILEKVLAPEGGAVRLRYYHRMSKNQSYSARRPYHLQYYHCYLSLRELQAFQMESRQTDDFSANQIQQMRRWLAGKPIQSEDDSSEAA